MQVEIKENVLYSPKDLAEILSLNERTVQKLLRAGRLPGKKIGKRRWYTRGRDLLAMVGDERLPEREAVLEDGGEAEAAG